MSSPEHQAYRNQLLFWFRSRASDPDVAAQLERYRDAAAVLWELDLESARAVLQGCYSPNPRGGDPWDPIVVLRSLLLMVLVVQTSISKWARDLAGSRVLRVLAGLREDEGRPGVGTFYDFLARLHDGPIRKTCEHHERPSEAERRRSRTPRAKPPKDPQSEPEPAESLRMAHFIADRGHDAEPIYRYCLEHGTIPVIPLKGAAARSLAQRGPDSERAGHPPGSPEPEAEPAGRPDLPGRCRDGTLGLGWRAQEGVHLPGQGRHPRAVPPCAV